jgi:hypothetical protein
MILMAFAKLDRGAVGTFRPFIMTDPLRSWA